MKYPLSELVLNDKGQVYHLGLHPENLAEKIIVVGDQDRVEQISRFFDTIEHKSAHRELEHAGFYRKKSLSMLGLFPHMLLD